MTREEAIEALTSKDVNNSDMMLEALEMAIEALEQLTSYEQTINKLTKAISEQEPVCIGKVEFDEDKLREIVKEQISLIAIQEPCEDLISRADAIDACDQSINLFEAVDRIKELPRK